jgi:hypothetical protein
VAAAVLPLATDAAAAGEQAGLDVLAEGGLREADALGPEDLDDGSRGQAAGELALDARQLSRVEIIH